MSVTNKDIVSTAKQYQGKLKYDFGSDAIEEGTGDCSSYTEHVFGVYGIDIGADTNAQYQQGYGVNKEDAKAGDLVFFQGTYPNDHIDNVSHVGIMVDNNRFIHLSEKGGCTISNLSNIYYSKHFLAIKRLRDVSYENYEHVPEQIVMETAPDTDLKWWGDIVKVVTIVLVIGGGVAFLSLSLLGSVKTPKIDMVKNLVKAGKDNE
jgi:hypothetical protein